MPSPTLSPRFAVLAGSIAAALLSCGPRADREDPDLAFHRGLNALDERRFERARAHFTEDLEHHPERAESRRLAGLAWASGSYQSATRTVEHWRRYLELRPDDVEIQSRLTRMLLLLGEWQEAQAASERLGEDAGSRVLRARALLEIDPARAAEAIAAAPAGDDPRLHATAAEIHLRAGDREQALLHATRAVELAPLDARSTYLLARLRRRAGDAEAAAELLATHQLLTRLTGTAGAAEPSPVEALRLVRELEPRIGEHGLRLEKLRRLVETGAHDEARTLLPRLGDLPTATRLELAGLAERIGELDAARGLLEDALERPAGERAGDRDAGEREALYGLALLARRQGDAGGARERVEAGLERFPHSARFHHLLGRLELEAGQVETAAGRFERALELAPWKSDCRIDLANLLLGESRSDEAAAVLDAAPGDDPAIDGYRRRHGLE